MNDAFWVAFTLISSFVLVVVLRMFRTPDKDWAAFLKTWGGIYGAVLGAITGFYFTREVARDAVHEARQARSELHEVTSTAQAAIQDTLKEARSRTAALQYVIAELERTIDIHKFVDAQALKALKKEPQVAQALKAPKERTMQFFPDKAFKKDDKFEFQIYPKDKNGDGG